VASSRHIRLRSVAKLRKFFIKRVDKVQITTERRLHLEDALTLRLNFVIVQW